MNEFMNAALKEADKAYLKKEIPIGAVVVQNNKIIGKGFNRRLKNTDVTNHAEIIAIKKAARHNRDWRLNDCDLYVTLEPCNMCKAVINEARIKHVYYLIAKLDNKKGYYKTQICEIENNDDEKERYRQKMSTFFQTNCKR